MVGLAPVRRSPLLSLRTLAVGLRVTVAVAVGVAVPVGVEVVVEAYQFIDRGLEEGKGKQFNCA